uniref:Uncharacterized protein n=1 Tax=Equus caballus TaxID=9796 RepID=A0A3Q2HS15_HORSE
MDWEQQTGTQQLDWEQPQEPQPPLDPHRIHSPPWNPHRSHSPPCSPHRSHSPPCSPHRSHSPPCSPHRSHSPLCHSSSRNRLAHSSTRACSSTRAHSSWSHSPHSWSRSPHSWSHSPHSWSRSPHSWSRSLRNNHSSPWFWWVEGGAGQRSRERKEGQVWTPLVQEPLYPCPGSGVMLGTWSLTGSCVCHLLTGKFWVFLAI